MCVSGRYIHLVIMGGVSVVSRHGWLAPGAAQHSANPATPYLTKPTQVCSIMNSTLRPSPSRVCYRKAEQTTLQSAGILHKPATALFTVVLVGSIMHSTACRNVPICTPAHCAWAICTRPLQMACAGRCPALTQSHHSQPPATLPTTPHLITMQEPPSRDDRLAAAKAAYDAAPGPPVKP